MPKSIVNGPVSDQDIRRSAAGIVVAFQGNAEAQCDAMILKMHAKDDAFGVDVWRRISSWWEARLS